MKIPESTPGRAVEKEPPAIVVEDLTIAAALIHSPRLLFLDEPTVGLDVVNARSLRSLIQEFNRRGVTIFLTTHYLEEADLLCDRIAILVKGKLLMIESPAKLKAMAQEES